MQQCCQNSCHYITKVLFILNNHLLFSPNPSWIASSRPFRFLTCNFKPCRFSLPVSLMAFQSLSSGSHNVHKTSDTYVNFLLQQHPTSRYQISSNCLPPHNKTALKSHGLKQQFIMSPICNFVRSHNG